MRHILTKKSTKRKRQLRRASAVDSTNTRAIRSMLPYSS
jgi:large subunit ribosomal protein L35